MIIFKTEYKFGGYQEISIDFENKQFYISNISYFSEEKITLEPKEASKLIIILEILKFKEIRINE